MFGWFSKKKVDEGVREETKKSFELVKKDIGSVTGWIKHLDSEKNIQKRDIEEIKEDLSTIKIELEGIKNIVSVMGNVHSERVFKTAKQPLNKQLAVYPVQTTVQTTVQTPNLEQFSVTERAIIWILLNTEMKLSYDDLAAIMQKEKSTVRGQINSIRQKSAGVIEEQIEKNGKKRVFIPDSIKEKLLKRVKVSENPGKRGKSRGN